MQPIVDRTGFAATLLVIFLVAVPLMVYPEQGEFLLVSCYDWIADSLGFLYALAGCGALALLLYLAMSRHGNITLGEEGCEPDFSTFSWVGMLFCAGVGAGLMYWSSIEWAYYYQSPPFGAEPSSVEAAKWASAYGVFHWGVTAWAFYCLPTIAIAYPFYVRGVPVLKFSTSCHYFLKGNESSMPSRAIDFFFMVALVGGAASSLGFSTPLIATLVSRLTGVPTGLGMEVAVVVLCVVIFSVSNFLGLEAGIRRLSNLNMVLAFALLVYVLVAGPTVFLCKAALSSLGTVAQNFIQMNAWTHPFSESRFFEDWTVFYWAWWVAYGPFVGLFVTRISRGRTIRQVVTGMLIYGPLGGAVFYWTLGNFSLYQELNESVAVVELLSTQDGNRAIVAGFERLPFATLFMGLFCLVSLIFSATTYDSAAYTLASNATLRLAPGQDPARWHRTFWSCAVAVLPIALMYAGGLKVAQTAVLIVSLPILAIGIVMSVALLKSLNATQR